MPNDINLEDLYDNDEFWKGIDWEGYNNEVNKAVEKGTTIKTKDKDTEILRYQQKVAEYKRLYYQWVYTWLLFIASTCFAILLNILSNNKLFDSNGFISPIYLVFVIIIAAIIVIIFIVYIVIVKPKFNASHGISLDLERVIRTIEMRKNMENPYIPHIVTVKL